MAGRLAVDLERIPTLRDLANRYLASPNSIVEGEVLQQIEAYIDSTAEYAILLHMITEEGTRAQLQRLQDAQRALHPYSKRKIGGTT